MENEKTFRNIFWPQFRDADNDGLIGLRGMMGFFQDITSHQMYELNHGNAIISKTYNKVWIITKYTLKIVKKIHFLKTELEIKCWIEKNSSPVMMYQNFVIERAGEVYAYGKVELCTIDLESNKLGKLKDIDFPYEQMLDKSFDDVYFEKIVDKNLEKEYCFTHTVKFTDLDTTQHMNNLAYVNMFINAFDSGFYANNSISNFTINYLDQCYENEQIKIYKNISEKKVTLIGEKESGKVAVKCIFELF